jgi:hypothetical protein
MVGADGRSAVPEGIVDLASLADGVEMDEAIEEKLHELWEAGANYTELKATYKLEIIFTEERSMHKPFGGFVYALSNGGFAHGGGDEAIYFCSAKVDRDGVTKTCNNPLALKWLGRDNALCPRCKQLIDPADLTGQIYAKLSVQNWTQLVLKVFNVLGCDADLRIGTLKGDLRVTTQQEMDHSSMGEGLTALRKDRRYVVYPLSNLIRDTSAGASLQGRIRAFLSA